MRTVSYRDVAILLGGRQNKLIAALDKITSGVLLGGMVKVEDLLSWFDAKSDFVRLSNDLLGHLSENRRSLRRFSRTQRIEAAHTVIVMAAFFETLDEFDLPVKLKLSAHDQKQVFGTESTSGVGRWLADPGVLPDPAQPYTANVKRVAKRYTEMIVELSSLVLEVSVGGALDEVHREKLYAQLRLVPQRARARYEDHFRALVADYPEVACWANLIEHEATRHEVRTSLEGLERMLAEVVAGRSPERRRAALSRAYRSLLKEPVLPSDDIPAELSLPAVERAYVNPRFRVRVVDRDSNPSRESWWTEADDAGDVQRFLVGHLTSPRATRAPLVVLGQPGSGKSMLTKVLAARLPATDFMPVRVELRDVPAEADIQEQIEHAVRLATGERVQWPDLAQAAGDALPVILLDGFDELLQATGVHQTDYLAKVSRFQQREADQDRPVAVVVTTRTAVAELARFPEESVAVRLEPFDDSQIRLWVRMWNAENTSIEPLDVDSVLTYRELAEQPLLLLMLALYDADGNALREEGPISRSALYERLLMRFAYREVAKHCVGYPEEDLRRRAELELRRLSVVAFAMFNRGTQWITQDALNDDFTALGVTRQSESAGMRRSLSGAELAIGKFFFIHRARAHQADQQVSTYEFLHATFGEYLVARMTWHEIRVLAAKAYVSDTSFFDQGLVDDSALYAFLSFAPLASRGPVVRFLAQMAEQVPSNERQEIAAVLIRLLRTAHDQRRERGGSRYEPLALSVPRRCAAYSVNLVIAITALLGRVRGSQLFGRGEDVVVRWMKEALLWRSQFDYYDTIDILALRRVWHENERDIELSLDITKHRGVDPMWSHPRELRSGSSTRWTRYRDATLSNRQNFFCSPGDDHLAHLVEPLTMYVGDAANLYVSFDETDYRAFGNVLLQAVLSPVTDSTRDFRSWTYLWCVRLLDGHQLRLIIDRIRTDRDIPAGVVAEIIEACLPVRPPVEPLVRCVMDTLGRDPAVDDGLLGILDLLLDDTWPFELRLECQLRLFDLDYHQRTPFIGGAWKEAARKFIESGQRPDLAKRARWMWRQLDE
ncbi:NACHT domain-containing NTPase [Kibdelosporangium persicum]|uniref:AAA ATPase domain n=1 Tax=Kibdelosporangium persicum TaxID=2698649 RepID=A0ABX2EX72_9PSEU|nr:hypothetical protein [Kibdelosporangium persicum]NRN63636.1 AAA ATPase domain [Kibdelosporangium persicum]